MKNFKTLILGIFTASLFTACSTDDTIITENQLTTNEIAEDSLEEEAKSRGLFQSLKALKEAKVLLASIHKDGGVPFNFFNPALKFTASQNVFLPRESTLESIGLLCLLDLQLDSLCFKVGRRYLMEIAEKDIM